MDGPQDELAAELEHVRLRYPLFAKPLTTGTGMGIDQDSCVHDPTALEELCTRLLDRFGIPVLVEEFLSRRSSAATRAESTSASTTAASPSSWRSTHYPAGDRGFSSGCGATHSCAEHVARFLLDFAEEKVELPNSGGTSPRFTQGVGQ